MNEKKRFLPNSNPSWGRELPDDFVNSLVDKGGKNWDNGYNYDDIDDHAEEMSFDDLAKDVKFDQEAAARARKQASEKTHEN